MKFSDVVTDFNGELRAANAKLHQEKYDKVAKILNAAGTIVRRLAYIEKVAESDETPIWVASSDLLEVIFPPRQVQELQPASYNLNKGQYKRIDQRWNFDPAEVAGHLLFQYDSHSKVPLLIISDIQPGFSDLPETVCKHIAEIFGE